MCVGGCFMSACAHEPWSAVCRPAKPCMPATYPACCSASWRAQVMPGQWEFQVGPSGPLDVGDEVCACVFIMVCVGRSMQVSMRYMMQSWHPSRPASFVCLCPGASFLAPPVDHCLSLVACLLPVCTCPHVRPCLHSRDGG